MPSIFIDCACLQHHDNSQGLIGIAMNLWNLIYRLSWGLLAILVLIGLALVFTPKARELARLQAIKTGLETSNAEKSEQIKELQIRQERFVSDPEYVEQTARESGLVMADEVVYKFTNEPMHSHQP